MLKAKALHLDVPTQIVWADTWDDAARIPRKVKRASNRQTQATATRAWNLLNALFYKAGKVPWRLLPNEADYRTNFLGIGFYRDLGGQQLWTSTAQMFDERGRGLILRGARAQTETSGRHPCLTALDAEALVAQSIAAYKSHHKRVPARLVVLKTSRFRPEEAEGIDAALDRFGIELCDLLWVQESSPIALFRDGNYPVLRGTFVDLHGKGRLYTRGSVPYYGTYPGLRVPRPLPLVPHENSDSALYRLAEEVLALTKVNWNSTQFDQKLPAPIKASREVGRVLKQFHSTLLFRPIFGSTPETLHNYRLGHIAIGWRMSSSSTWTSAQSGAEVVGQWPPDSPGRWRPQRSSRRRNPCPSPHPSGAVLGSVRRTSYRNQDR